jgi:hypothetical protein
MDADLEAIGQQQRQRRQRRPQRRQRHHRIQQVLRRAMPQDLRKDLQRAGAWRRWR